MTYTVYMSIRTEGVNKHVSMSIVCQALHLHCKVELFNHRSAVVSGVIDGGGGARGEPPPWQAKYKNWAPFS